MAINLGDVSKFKYLAHKVMPLVFDETLSYYEFLCKVIAKLNEVIDNENTQNATLEDFSVQMDEWNEEAIQKYNEFTAAIDLEIEQFEQSMEERQGAFETEIGERADNFEDSITDQQDAFEGEIRDAWNEFFETYLQTLGVVQTTGTSTTDVMSQKAVTDGLNNSVSYSTQSTTETQKKIARQNIDVDGIKEEADILMEIDKNETNEEWKNGEYNSQSGGDVSGVVPFELNNILLECYGIRTPNYISSDVIAIQTKGNYYPIIYAFNNDTYVGIWYNGSFGIYDRIYSDGTQLYNLAEIRTTYPSYDLKLCIIDSTSTAAIDVDTALENYFEYYAMASEKELSKECNEIIRWETGNLSNTGQISGSTNTKRIRTNYIRIDNNIFTLTVGTNYVARYHIYDRNKTFISQSSNVREKTVKVPITSGYYIKLVAWNITETDLSPSEGNNIKVSYDVNFDDIEDNAAIEYEDNLSISMFTTIGVVGDSWSKGTIYNPNTSTHGLLGTYDDLSWGKIIERKNGCEVTNFGKGGLTTKTWLTDAQGLTALLADSAKSMYIINLGINDQTAISAGTETLGSIDDVDVSDYTQNPDTFYGNYGKIIGSILNYASTAKVVCVSIMREAERVLDIAIKEIAGKYNIPYIDVTEDYYFTSNLFESSICAGHPLAYGYAGIADSMERLLKKCVKNNLTYFGNYTGQ